MNYLLIYPDELRAESLGCYGHPLVKTPNIDALAAEGTLFEQNYTQHPVCGPSRACLATGWYPHVDGRRSYYLPGADIPNFFSYLKDAGFTTAHAGKDDMFTGAGMREVFSELLPFHTPQTPRIPKPRSQEIGNSTMLRQPYPANYPDEDSRFTSETIGFMGRCADAGKPFMAMLSLFNPHPPYMALPEYYDLYDPAGLPPQRDDSWLDGKPRLYEAIHKYRHADENDPAVYRKVNAVYLGMVSYVDHLVGQLVAFLKENGLYEDTTIVLCSDHGDFAGDARLVEKWPSAMDDMLTRVPLIIRRPGCQAGHRVKELTQSIDILPTLCDFESVEIRHDQFGVSLQAQVEGAAGDTERAVYCEGGYDLREPHCFEPTCFMNVKNGRKVPGMDPDSQYYPKMQQQQQDPDTVCRVVMQRWKNWKLNIRTNGENELYDLAADPLEYRNLYDDPLFADIQNTLTLRLATWQTATSDVVPRIREA